MLPALKALTERDPHVRGQIDLAIQTIERAAARKARVGKTDNSGRSTP